MGGLKEVMDEQFADLFEKINKVISAHLSGKIKIENADLLNTYRVLVKNAGLYEQISVQENLVETRKENMLANVRSTSIEPCNKTMAKLAKESGIETSASGDPYETALAYISGLAKNEKFVKIVDEAYQKLEG
jgi:hypothetical protein